MDPTQKIACFVVDAAYEKISSEALEAAKTAFLDCLGVTLAGSKEDSARICALLAREEGARGESTVIGQGFSSSALLAALANGTAAHALDYDHSFGNMGQPTAALVPAVFALGEALRASGRDVLAAYVAGFEVTAILIRAIPEHSKKGGWHSTGTLGSLGAAAACARLFRLDESRVQMALGIASSMASGIVSNFGTMTKPLHAGLAAKNGILAARLARSGFSSSPRILDRAKGFFQVFSRDLPVKEGAFEALGVRFDLVERGIRIKPYPCGGLTHSAVDSLLELRAQHGITPESIEKIHVAVGRHAYENIIYHKPETGLQGKFSMPYILARALVHGKLTLEHFTDEAVRDASIRRLGEKIFMEHEPEIEDAAEGRRPSRVTIRLKDGRTLSRHADYPKGGRQSPLTPEEIRQKFVECAGRTIGRQAVDGVLDYLERLEALADLAPLCKLLMGTGEK